MFLSTTVIAFNKNYTPITTKKNEIANEMQKSLQKQLLEIWYPLALDTIYGGFLSDFNHQWKPKGRQNKFIVTQARHVWSTSKASQHFSNNKQYQRTAKYGANYLQNALWDEEFGGFFNLVDRKGKVIKQHNQIIKNAYGNAFAIYGLVAYYKMSGDATALNLAQKTFYWLDNHSYDSVFGGYFQFLARDGTPFTDGFNDVPPKDYNSSIHVLEAFTELYGIWPNEKLRERLQSLLIIIRDTIITEKGYMNLYFFRDWKPLSHKDSSTKFINANHYYDHISFGHDVEIAYLMLEASLILGIENDSVTLKIAKKLIDHALMNGWDNNLGGLYDEGYYFKGDNKITIIKDTKEWWSQAEALNSFLIMADIFPDDEMDYYQKFTLLWDYVKTYLIDQKHGGWYWGGLDKEPALKRSYKGSIWKGNYHTSRSLMNCINRLNNSNE